MKKIDFKSFIIGMLTCLSAMLLIGAGSGDHTHSAKDIKYKSWEFGGYGTLQNELSDIISKINNKADSYHSHYDYAPSYHSHY